MMHVLLVVAFSLLSIQQQFAVASLIGSFNVNSGPVLYNPPLAYSCLAACALLFGGNSTDYYCSTNSSYINHDGFISTFGEGCSIAPEGYVFTTSGLYFGIGDTSAYVHDSIFFDGCYGHNPAPINYCFSITHQPSASPTHQPSASPTHQPSHAPTHTPSKAPSHKPSKAPSHSPSKTPTHKPTKGPSQSPSGTPSVFACRPQSGLNQEACTKLQTYCAARGVIMKWTGKGCGNSGDGGCQCNHYCGFSCKRSCNAGKGPTKQCKWIDGACHVYNYGTQTKGPKGTPITQCY